MAHTTLCQGPLAAASGPDIHSCPGSPTNGLHASQAEGQGSGAAAQEVYQREYAGALREKETSSTEPLLRDLDAALCLSK